MALSPKEMEQAILMNLPAKTGKSLDEWMAIISKSGIQQAKEQLQFLKKEFGLGHFQATVITKKLENNTATDYTDEAALLDAQFTGKNTALRNLYEVLALKVLALGKDVCAKPCKTYIPFYRKTQFLMAKPKNGLLYLTFTMSGQSFRGEKLSARGLGLPEKFAFTISLKEESDVNEGLMEWIKEALKNH